jgi:hypothetical protein
MTPRERRRWSGTETNTRGEEPKTAVASCCVRPATVKSEIRGSVTFRVLLAAASAFALAAAGDAVYRQGTEAPLSAARSPEELAKLVEARICAAPADSLDTLVASPDPALAVAAAWERVRRTTPADTTDNFKGPFTTMEARYRAIPGPDSAVLARFVGLVEGRLQLPVPAFWAASIECAKYNGQRTVWFPIGEPVSPMLTAALKTIKGRSVPRRSGHDWIVDVGGLSEILPASGEEVRSDLATEMLSGDKAYIALYNSYPALSYRLFAVSRRNGRIIWTSQVWAEGHGDGYGWSGVGHHVVELEAAGDRLAVFGISGVAYIEVFDIKTGKNLFRFGTSDFHNPPPMPETGGADGAKTTPK